MKTCVLRRSRYYAVVNGLQRTDRNTTRVTPLTFYFSKQLSLTGYDITLISQSVKELGSEMLSQLVKYKLL